MTTLELIAWPFHAGLRDVGMGAGATALAGDSELHAQLLDAGLNVHTRSVEPVDESWSEVARIFELDRRLARQVAAVRADGSFPIVLAGNCISCLGTTAGIRKGSDLGVVWLDAHADFDTPEDNLSGFTDVMGLAVLTGGCWRALRETIPEFATVQERDVVLVGTRDLEPYQRERIAASHIRVVPGAVDRAEFQRALDELRQRVRRVYFHVDLDVLDLAVGRANQYAADGGPDLETVLFAINETFARFEVGAAAITAYDPRSDAGGRIAAAARTIVHLVGQRRADCTP